MGPGCTDKMPSLKTPFQENGEEGPELGAEECERGLQLESGYSIKDVI